MTSWSARPVQSRRAPRVPEWPGPRAERPLATSPSLVLGVDSAGVSSEADIASIAGQLAGLTRTVAVMERQLKTMSERADSQQRQADSQQARTEAQQERIDLAARELGDVSERLRAAANALRESI